MMDPQDNRSDPATLHARAGDAARAAVGAAMLTSYEQTLTWCVLTLLSARGTPTPGRSRPSLPTGIRLTARETDVIALVALGLTNAQVAARLFLSRRTVDQHLSSIYNRLGVSSRAAATRFAILNELC
ncbi:MAG: response regulator transcription factor [Thermomicrobiales bacterium]